MSGQDRGPSRQLLNELRAAWIAKWCPGPAAEGGAVLVDRTGGVFEVIGWAAVYRNFYGRFWIPCSNAGEYRPGTFAVGSDNRIWIADGGSDAEGAIQWIDWEHE